uniref:Anoctamin dimerisation domain-containing protein n=1 Tax=Ditylenchus dipsaci TaxID=166011 RepID=A0A915EBB7_9BILA
MESKRKRFKELHDEPTLDIDQGYLNNANASNYWAESLASSSRKIPTIKQGNHFQAHYREFPLDGGDSDNAYIELPDRQFGEQPQESTFLINSKEAFEMDSFTTSDNTLTIDFIPPMTDQPPVQSAARKSATPKPLMHSRASSYFSDGMRRIDFVLAYDPSEKENKDVDEEATTSGSSGRNSPQRHTDKRKIFETNLQLLGLELEHAAVRNTHTRFVLIHALSRSYSNRWEAEVMNVKMPVHQNDIKRPTNIMEGAVNIFLRRFKFLDFDEKIKKRIDPADYFTQPFIEQHLECFVNHEIKKPSFLIVTEVEWFMTY